MPQQSLNTTSPEAIAHGTEITIQVNGVTIGEIFELDYDEDNKIEAIHVLGSRRIGRRRGNLEVKGSIKGYWLNGALRNMFLGGAPTTAGTGSSVYHSAVGFQRFNIVVTSAVAGGPATTLINCVFEKDAVKWAADKITDETINFVAEDVLGQ